MEHLFLFGTEQLRK
jgi:hypothetical protein